MLAGAAAVAWAQPGALEQARGAVERRDYTSAIGLYERLLAADPVSADLLIEAARVYGYADRNADAAGAYRRALAAAPARRGDILPSLAWQCLWSGDAAEALGLFDELAASARGVRRAEMLDGVAQSRQALGDMPAALAAFREALSLAPADPRLQRRTAMALLWNDRHDEAIAALSGLADRDRSDRELQWMLANALNFAGRHREALAIFLAQPQPQRSGERVDLARAWRWAGYEDRALPLLAEPLDAEARWLRQHRVERETRPYVYATFERAEDRDALNSRIWVLGAGWRPTPGANIEVNLRRLALEDPAGRPEATSLEVSGRLRVGEPGDAAGTFWPSVSLRANRLPGWSPLTGALRLQWLPRDRLRFDAEATRELVETPRAVAHRASVDAISLGGDWRPGVRQAYAASLAALRFDDGTRRLRWTFRAEHALTLRPRWTVGVEGQQFRRSPGGAGADRGYWNPERYAEARAFTALTHEFRPFDLVARIGFGRSRERDAGGTSTGRPDMWELGLAADLSVGWRARLVAGGSGQGLGVAGGGAGYWRRFVNLSLVGWF